MSSYLDKTGLSYAVNKIKELFVKKTDITNNLTSTSTTNALSANMGRVLNNSINQLSDNKVDKVAGKWLSTNDYVTADKNKLAGIEEQANKTVVDSALSSSSTNPVQNKVVNTAITQLNENKVDKNNLPVASGSALGCVKVGTNLSISNGVLSATDTKYGTATQSANGLMLAADKKKLDGIASGAQVNSVTGVKGNSEGSYRTGNINLTPANIGAAASGDFTRVQITPSIQSGVTFAGQIYKTGRVISVNFIIIAKGGSGDVTQATIPSGYRPSNDQQFAVVGPGTDGRCTIGRITTAGNIVLYAPLNGSYYWGQCTYIIP